MKMRNARHAVCAFSDLYIIFFLMRQTVDLQHLQEAIMSGEQPSNEQIKASQAQSLADQTGNNKEQASKMQSEADRRAVPKHGL